MSEMTPTQIHDLMDLIREGVELQKEINASLARIEELMTKTIDKATPPDTVPSIDPTYSGIKLHEHRGALWDKE